MVSCGPDVQSYNYTHMYSFEDLRGNLPKQTTGKNTIYDYIANNNNKCTRFRTIVDKAKMSAQLGEIDADFTILIPTDDYLSHIPQDFFDYMDDGMARHILWASSINRKIEKKYMTASPVSYFYTLNSKMRMYVTNIKGVTRINNCVSIVKYDINLANGVIHLTDGLIVPNEDHFLN